MTNIIEINQDQFLDQVVEKSKKLPVVVDFWAPWCGPCKQLTPILEKLINKKIGKIILAKINVDENQGLAAQLNIQSIPTVYGFVDGKPVDAFQGAQPESKIEVMIDKLISLTPGNEVPQLLDEAEQLFKDQKFEQAEKIYENLVTMDPGNIKIISGLLRCLVQLNKYNEVNEMLNSLDDEIINNEEILKIKKLIDNTNDGENSVSIDELTRHLINSPTDKDTRYKLANQLLMNNEFMRGFQELLEIYNQDSKWNDEAAKKKLLEYFDMLGFNDPNVIKARKLLSSLMFK